MVLGEGAYVVWPGPQCIKCSSRDTANQTRDATAESVLSVEAGGARENCPVPGQRLSAGAFLRRKRSCAYEAIPPGAGRCGTALDHRYHRGCRGGTETAGKFSLSTESLTRASVRRD